MSLEPTKKKRLEDVEIGDVIVRHLGGEIPMELRVTHIDDVEDVIYCGPWEFDMATGAEIDAELGWGPPPKHTGSYIEAK